MFARLSASPSRLPTSCSVECLEGPTTAAVFISVAVSPPQASRLRSVKLASSNTRKRGSSTFTISTWSSRDPTVQHKVGQRGACSLAKKQKNSGTANDEAEHV